MDLDWDENRFLQAIEFGLKKLKKPEITLTKDQVDAIRSFAQGKNVFVSLPTGSGKSIIFQLMPFVFEFLSLSGDDDKNFIFIVHPLLGLIDDQMNELEAAGHPCLMIPQLNDTINKKIATDSTVNRIKKTNKRKTESEKLASSLIEQVFEKRNFRFIFSTPEAIVTKKEWEDFFQEPEFQRYNVGLIVDEAHCVVNWGENFRPRYSELHLIAAIQQAQVLALTATCTKEIRKYFQEKFFDKKGVEILRSPSKPNITLRVKKLDEKFSDFWNGELKRLADEKDKFPRTVVFFKSFYYLGEAKEQIKIFQKQHPDIRQFIGYYHALSPRAKTKSVLEGVSVPTGGIRLILASSAFGMGINVPNIERVWHIHSPEELEDYIQQVGRAGRQFLKAEAILFIDSLPIKGTMKAYLQNSSTCRHKIISLYFGFPFESEQGGSCCDICEKGPDANEGNPRKKRRHSFS